MCRARLAKTEEVEVGSGKLLRNFERIKEETYNCMITAIETVAASWPHAKGWPVTVTELNDLWLLNSKKFAVEGYPRHPVRNPDHVTIIEHAVWHLVHVNLYRKHLPIPALFFLDAVWKDVCPKNETEMARLYLMIDKLVTTEPVDKVLVVGP
jgi:hypothetical protein